MTVKQLHEILGKYVDVGAGDWIVALCQGDRFNTRKEHRDWLKSNPGPKGHPFEHRLFCFISQNWAGQPLVSYETALKFIRTTKTESGLRCRALLDTRHYATGIKITREQKAQINLKPHRVLPKWNYTQEVR